MSLLFALWLLASQALAGPGSVAVLYFQNQGNPELEPLKVGLAQMLTTDLVGAGGAKIVERTQLQAVMEELKLGHSAVVDPSTRDKVGKLIGAEYLVLGSYFALAGTLRVDARLVRTETGEIVHAAGANGLVADFLALEHTVASSFRSMLASLLPGTMVPLPPPAPAAAQAAPLNAVMALSEGLIALDNHELPRARESFEKALAADSRLEAAKAQLAAMSL